LAVLRCELRSRRHALVVSGIVATAVIAVAATPQLLGPRVTRAFEGLTDAKPAWLWLSALFVVATLVAWSLTWHSAVRAVGGELSREDAVARYAIGSAVNTFLPARIGDAVRIALFSRALENRERIWTTAGVYTTIGAARALCCGVLIVIAYLSGVLPLWSVIASALFVLLAVVAALVARRRGGDSRLAHFFDAYRELGRHPRRAAPVLFWTAVATVARTAAVASTVSSLGIDRSLAAALVIVPALDAASLLPIGPGGLGLSSGAVALALKGIGVGVTTALTVGIAYHAIEAAAGIVFGLSGGLVLAAERRPYARDAAVALVGVAVAIAIAGAFGDVLLDLA
jgi:uncharacterized membrane protein YbhN (UPF0104 family)